MLHPYLWLVTSQHACSRPPLGNIQRRALLTVTYATCTAAAQRQKRNVYASRHGLWEVLDRPTTSQRCSENFLQVTLQQLISVYGPYQFIFSNIGCFLLMLLLSPKCIICVINIVISSIVFCLNMKPCMQGRPLLARLGRRTLVIVDVPYVHQLLEAYVSKLFALSYSIASLDVHGTDPLNHFVHCFTHRYQTAVTFCAACTTFMHSIALLRYLLCQHDVSKQCPVCQIVRCCGVKSKEMPPCRAVLSHRHMCHSVIQLPTFVHWGLVYHQGW